MFWNQSVELLLSLAKVKEKLNVKIYLNVPLMSDFFLFNV